MTMPSPQRLPTFVVIGAMKAGTTTLHEWLARHRDVFMSDPKELDFFLDERNWGRGLDWYRSCFVDADGAGAVGESSPDYTKTHNHPRVAERMYSVIPDAALVYVVREPVDRMRSMYRHLVLDGTETRGFAEAISADADYEMTSQYMRHITAYLEFYPPESLLVITTEQMAADPHDTIASVLGHIGVDPAAQLDVTERHNVTTTDPQESPFGRRLRGVRVYGAALERSWRYRSLHERVFMHSGPLPDVGLPQGVERALRERLVPSTTALERFLGRELSEWRA